MIAGAGVDVAPIARVARLVRDHAADLDRIFTAGERRHCDRAPAPARAGRYAAAFAAKEAVFKALGTGWRSDLEWSDVDTSGIDVNGGVALTGGVRREAVRQGVARVLVSAAITSASAVATAVAVSAAAPAAGERVTEPLAWNEVVASYDRASDYTTLYHKEEREISNGEPQRIKLSFRKPLDVRMEWLNEDGKVDQVAVYRQGFNDGKLIAKKSGMLGSMLGTMHLDPRDKKALSDSRHPITEVGIGNMIGEISRAMRSGQIETRPAVEETLDGQPVTRFELAGPAEARLFGVEGARRAIVWVDQRLKLPVKAEILDGSGRMLERHRFTELRLNVGLTDSTFTL